MKGCLNLNYPFNNEKITSSLLISVFDNALHSRNGLLKCDLEIVISFVRPGQKKRSKQIARTSERSVVFLHFYFVA